MATVFESIQNLLDTAGVPYRHLHHEPTPTSADSARVRGEDLHTGGKALLLKIDGRFALFVLRASDRLDSPAIKRRRKAKKIRFATTEELRTLTGLIPGAMPPFGRPILPLDLYVETAVGQNSLIAFNAGEQTDSIIMSVPDYLALAEPKEIFSFAL